MEIMSFELRLSAHTKRMRSPDVWRVGSVSLRRGDDELLLGACCLRAGSFRVVILKLINVKKKNTQHNHRPRRTTKYTCSTLGGLESKYVFLQE